MKKIIVFLFVIVIVCLNFSDDKTILLPDQSIRYRIIANSNSNEDQSLKWKINEEILPIISEISSAKNISEARKEINYNLENINNEIKKYTNNYDISFGYNYFPEKEYASVIYGAGDYESLVIKLGENTGDNWWCVIFPPLCLIEAEKDNLDDVTYTTYISEVIKKYS